MAAAGSMVEPVADTIIDPIIPAYKDKSVKNFFLLEKDWKAFVFSDINNLLFWCWVINGVLDIKSCAFLSDRISAFLTESAQQKGSLCENVSQERTKAQIGEFCSLTAA